MIPAKAFAGIVQVLQADPFSYRNFGPRWWRLKRMMTAAGWTTEAFLGLGDGYPDSEAEHRWDELDDDAFFAAAMAAHSENAQNGYNQRVQPNDGAESEFGDFVTMIDPDVEL